MEQFEPYPSLALAVLSGLLIGLEREKTRPAPESGRGFIGGIRTYPLIALIGAAAMMMSKTLGPWPLVVSGIAVGGLLLLTYTKDSETGHLGITSEASAFLTFLLGALSLGDTLIEPLSRRIFIVASIAVVSTLLLSSKTQLREFSTRISRDDVIATLKFLIVSVVVLPVLPNQSYGPYGALNPFHIGTMVLLIAGMGFVGYVAMRLFGHGRGLLLTGAIGGLVSSTAVTLASAARARQTPELAGLSSLAVIIASTIMFARVLAIVFVAERSLFTPLLLPMAAMGVTGLVFCAVYYVRERVKLATPSDVKLDNPFELGAALKFGALFIVILVVSRWAAKTFGDRGTYVTGALAGLADVDPITLSISNMVKNGQVETAVGQRTIVLAACANTLVKGVMALVLGGKVLGLRSLIAFAAVLAVGAIAVIVS